MGGSDWVTGVVEGVAVIRTLGVAAEVGQEVETEVVTVGEGVGVADEAAIDNHRALT